MKLIYYRLFAFCYGLVGSCSDVVMANGTWTFNHINTIWGESAHTTLVFPPVNTEIMADPASKPGPPYLILSIGQFRPEKNQLLQVCTSFVFFFFFFVFA